MHSICQIFLFLAFCHFSLNNAFNIDDSSGVGRVFDGIGGLSGGGATSRLLVSYPQTQRDQILDLLFKPNFGASLHILKVEIGGDAQTTDGTESSHMHTQDDQNYNRGYEWWLLEEAKKRNPNIKTYGLSWAFPSWVGNGSGDPFKYPDLTTKYTVNWILGAKRVHNVDIDYIGIWNERGYSSDYIKILRSTLDANNLTKTTIVANDAGWEGISGDVLNDPDLAKAVGIIGAHYPGTTSDSNAQKTGKPLWASEDYSTYNDLVGGGCWARILNQNYVNGYMTSTISWNLIASYYPGLPYYRDGLMTAVQPWSGYYEVESPIWGSAHTTQFTQPGWNYLNHNNGSGLLASGGSYVSFKNPTTGDLTIVIEKMSHDHSICIRPNLPAYNTNAEVATFVLKGSFAKITKLSLWYTHHDFTNQDASIFFMKQNDITVTNGQFSLNISVDSIYTLTTTTGQSKGGFSNIPPAAGFPFTYSDNFEKYDVDSEADYWADQAGVWEIFDTSPDSHGKVMRQVVTSRPICWADDYIPVSVLGDYSWQTADMSMDIYLEQNGQVFIGQGVQGTTQPGGIFLVVDQDGNWWVSDDLHWTHKYYSGKTTAPGINKWFTLRLNVNKGIATGQINGNNLFVNQSVAVHSGWAAMGTGGYYKARFDNFNLKGAELTCKTPLTSGEQVAMYPCVGTSDPASVTQIWDFNSDGTIKARNTNLCFNATGSDPDTGKPDIKLASCNSGLTSQVFAWSGSALIQKSTGQCLDIIGQSGAVGTRIELWDCNGGSNQQWRYTASSGQLITNLNGMCAGACD